MFGLFKKTTINSSERLSLIERELTKKGEKLSKEVLFDLQYCNKDFDSISKDTYPILLSTILTLQFGFGIIALNIAIKKQENYREIVYDTLVEWENKITQNSIQFSRLLKNSIQKEICTKFVNVHTELRFQLSKTQSVLQNLKIANNYFENSFTEIAEWYSNYYNLGSNERFIQYTRNHFLSSFSYFDKFFANYKHI